MARFLSICSPSGALSNVVLVCGEIAEDVVGRGCRICALLLVVEFMVGVSGKDGTAVED